MSADQRRVRRESEADVYAGSAEFFWGHARRHLRQVKNKTFGFSQS